jgi:hypothetical protein
MIILDALQNDVAKTLAELQRIPNRSPHVIGRLDLSLVINESSLPRHDFEKYFTQSLDQVMTAVGEQFHDEQGRNTGFTGILLVGWEIFPALILHELSDVLFSMDLDVYLETCSPKFLEDSSLVATDSISGLVIRNGLLKANGNRQDCFDLEALKTTVKSFVSQACVRDFATFAWETVDDGVVISTAVLKRTYNWCGFYNVVPWIGPSAALYDGKISTFPNEPLSAFAWLKEPRVMELHEIWRSKKRVRFSFQILRRRTDS